MEDAVDDWLLREVCWLRNEDTVAHGIRWAQDVRTKFSLIFSRSKLNLHLLLSSMRSDIMFDHSLKSITTLVG